MLARARWIVAPIVSTVVLAGCGSPFGRSDEVVTPTSDRPSPTKASPSPTPSAEERANGDVEGVFPKRPEGDRIGVVIAELDPPLLRYIGPCDLHRFDGVGAYAARCANEPSLVWIHASLHRAAFGDVAFDRENFLLSDASGRRYRPESELRGIFEDVDALFPPHGHFGFDDWVGGWLLFHVGARDVDVASLTYVDRKQEISVAFEGRQTIDRV